jgi:hypothetical protein
MDHIYIAVTTTLASTIVRTTASANAHKSWTTIEPALKKASKDGQAAADALAKAAGKDASAFKTGATAAASLVESLLASGAAVVFEPAADAKGFGFFEVELDAFPKRTLLRYTVANDQSFLLANSLPTCKADDPIEFGKKLREHVEAAAKREKDEIERAAKATAAAVTKAVKADDAKEAKKAAKAPAKPAKPAKPEKAKPAKPEKAKPAKTVSKGDAGKALEADLARVFGVK